MLNLEDNTAVLFRPSKGIKEGRYCKRTIASINVGEGAGKSQDTMGNS